MSVILTVGGFVETESKTVVAKGWEGDGELVLNGYRVSVWDDRDVLETDGGDGGTTTGLHIYSG